MLRKSLQNYAKVKAASSHSKGSSDYANCKENIPVHGGVASPSSQYSVCKPNSDKTPTSRFDHKKALAQNSWPAGPSDETVSPRVGYNNPYSTIRSHTKHTASLLVQPVPSDAGAATTRSTVSPWCKQTKTCTSMCDCGTAQPENLCLPVAYPLSSVWQLGEVWYSSLKQCGKSTDKQHREHQGKQACC